ncbi:MAG: hypothetical protein ACREJB_11615, partial [Planctomycetaceae bacterium]
MKEIDRSNIGNHQGNCMIGMIRYSLILLAFISPSGVASAQDDAGKTDETKQTEAKAAAEDKVSVTEHSV